VSTGVPANPRRPVLVLLHGFALHSGLWGDWPAGLASRVEPRAIDLPGHGTRPWDPRITDLAAAGLPVRSIVRASKLATIEVERVIRKAGGLAAPDAESAAAALRICAAF